MATKARRRLINDYKKIQDDPPLGNFYKKNNCFLLGIAAAPFSENIMQWLAVIYGKINSL